MGDKPVMYFHFASGDTRLTFAVGSNPMAGQQPRTAGAGAVSSTTCANTASKRQGCGSRSGGCNSSSASMSETRNSTMALMPPPNSSQVLYDKSGQVDQLEATQTFQRKLFMSQMSQF
ncbi:unnamed protein product [Acanthoscelides obtectus]|uniref:Uncharacterized protein n=1 Tax=Acanthoscelides obtectus TaxID=200917 RepID=A0A9P0PLY6_ACAOB|nr:unnamed protein product [Acanthoscelides obtectus]CAK1627724.1 hypothetical protein AOBTE_LOCUS4790 [Acanthoscelides obtectus]